MFIARFRTPCANGCGEYVKPGQLARMTDDGAAHADCDEQDPDRRVAEVCPRCRLEKPCWCE